MHLKTYRNVISNRSPFFLWLFLFSFSTGCGYSIADNDTAGDKPPVITIAVAANMQFAMDALIAAFTEETGIKCETTISSSGKLTAQILEGAPFDVFLSANMKYPEEISRNGLALTPPSIYAYGRLVLWSMKEGFNPDLKLLETPNIKHIALANPRLAPYGAAALEALKASGLSERVENKLVFGESISQTNQFVITGAAEVGFTSMSVVRSPQIANQGTWVEIDANTYSPIAQGVVVLKREGSKTDQAMQFFKFLSTEKAHHILDQFGYAVANRVL